MQHLCLGVAYHPQIVTCVGRRLTHYLRVESRWRVRTVHDEPRRCCFNTRYGNQHAVVALAWAVSTQGFFAVSSCWWADRSLQMSSRWRRNCSAVVFLEEFRHSTDFKGKQKANFDCCHQVKSLLELPDVWVTTNCRQSARRVFTTSSVHGIA